MRLLKEAKVSEITTFSRATIARKVEAGEFPKPIIISARRKAWPEEAIQKWMAEVVAKSEAA